MSLRFQASMPRLKISTFSSDIAHAVSRAEVKASDPSRQVLCAGPAGPALRVLSPGRSHHGRCPDHRRSNQAEKGGRGRVRGENCPLRTTAD